MNKTKVLLGIFLLLFFFIFKTLLYSQKSVNFEQIDLMPELTHNIITKIFQDSKGFLWIGTKYGLYKYDGYSFKQFLGSDSQNIISDNIIKDIFEDKNGNLWIGASKGINRLDNLNEHFNKYLFAFGPKDSIPISNIVQIFQDKYNNIYFITRNRIFIYNSQRNIFLNYLPDNNKIPAFFWEVKSIYLDRNNNLWIISQNNSIFLINIPEFLTNRNCDINSLKKTDFYVYNTFPKKRIQYTINTIIEDTSGNIWIGTDSGLLKLSLKNKNPVKKGGYKTIEDLYSIKKYLLPQKNRKDVHNIRAIYQDKQGNIWIGTEAYGLYKLNQKLEKLEFSEIIPGKYNSSPKITVSLIYEDRFGNLWLGTDGNGIYKKSQKKIIFSNCFLPESSSGNENYVYSFCEDSENNIWTGTQFGLYKFNKKDGRTHHFRKDISPVKEQTSEIITAMCHDKNNNLWLGTTGGKIYKFDIHRAKFQVHPGFLKDERNFGGKIKSIIEDDSGNIWIGRKGLYKVYPSTGKIKKYLPDSLSMEQLGLFNYLYRTKDNYLWIITQNRIFKFDLNTETYCNISIDYSNIITSNKMVVDRSKLVNSNIKDIKTICQTPDGDIWLGTFNGLCKLVPDPGNNGKNPNNRKEKYIIEPYPLNNLLDKEKIQGLLYDNIGNIWISTFETGIWKLDPSTGYTVPFSGQNGIKISRFINNSIFRGNDGTMYFGGNGGFISFNPETLNNETLIFPIKLTSFKIFEKEFDFSSDSGSRIIELPYYNNFVSFEFSMLDFINPKRNQYYYMLEGFDNQWIYSGNRRYVNYLNLRGGEYIFKVKGANSEGIWNNKGIALRFKVKTPIWERWWAFIIYALLLSGMVLLFIRYKTRKNLIRIEELKRHSQEVLESQEKERRRVSRELHDGVIQLIITSKLKLNQIESAIPSVMKIKMDEIRNLLDTTSREIRLISHNLHPSILDDIGLVEAIRDMCKEFSEKTDIETDFKVDNFPVELTMEIKTNLFRIIQESLNNIEKHSKASKVEISLSSSDLSLNVEVKDNGSGFEADNQLSSKKSNLSFGIRNMRERALLLKGDFKLISSPGNGTTILVKVPFLKQE